MGERVVVDPHRMTEPVEAVPLDYGRGGKGADAWRGFSARAAATWAVARAYAEAKLREFNDRAVPKVGGWRQVVFALGLAFALGGLGLSVGSGAGAIPMWLGGLLIGFVVRIPRWKDQ